MKFEMEEKFQDSSIQFQGKTEDLKTEVDRSEADSSSTGRVEALNLKFEIRKGDTEPRMNANRREWGMSYWLFVKSYWGEEEGPSLNG